MKLHHKTLRFQPFKEISSTFIRNHWKAGGLLLLSLLAVAGLWIWQIERKARQKLDQARQHQAQQNRIPFERSAIPPITAREIRFFQNTGTVRTVVRFGESYFAATDSGLLQLSTAGQVKRHFTVLDGLPESDLTCLGVFQSRLWIGTKSQGVATFDGQQFERWTWTDRQPQTITAFWTEAGRLLIGTRAGGLLQFDGTAFQELTTGPANRRIPAISTLTVIESNLFVGTFSEGLWINGNGRWTHVSTDQGLLSNRIVGVLVRAGNLLVGTDFGLCETELDPLLLSESPPPGQRVFRPLATLPTLAGLTAFRGQPLLVKDNGELLQLITGPRGLQIQRIAAAAEKTANPLAECRFSVLDDRLFLVGTWGIRQVEPAPNPTSPPVPGPFYQPPMGQFPTHNLVSALSLDRRRNIWIGTFRNGIDVVSSNGKLITHLESQAVREINGFCQTKGSDLMLAATSAGIVAFQPTFQAKQITVSDGLLSNSAAQVLPLDDGAPLGNGGTGPGLYVATSRGLSFGSAGRMSGMTNVNGLPGNSVTTLLPVGRNLLVGTMGGLAEIEGGRVARTYTTNNSKLTNNWISGLAQAGERLFVGTYGGGVFERLPSGEWHSFAAEIGNATVNPNALFCTAQRLFVGTLNGVWVLDLDSRQWTHLKAELPSPIVLSITATDRAVFFGTTSGLAQIENTYFNHHLD